MKKTIYIAMLCITTIAFSQEEKIQQSIDVNTSWEGKRCNGSNGLCHISSPDNKKQANTQITYNKDNNITFIIDRNKITKAEELKITGTQITTDTKLDTLSFVMEDDFELEPNTRTRLKIPIQTPIISKGDYPIQVTENTFIITLALK